MPRRAKMKTVHSRAGGKAQNHDGEAETKGRKDAKQTRAKSRAQSQRPSKGKCEGSGIQDETTHNEAKTAAAQEQMPKCTCGGRPRKSTANKKQHENCLQDICLCLLYTQFLKNLRNKRFPTAPLRQAPNNSRRDKSHEKCLQDICLCPLYTSYLKILCIPLQEPCLRIHVLASPNMDPLQDPRLRTHVSASLHLMGSLRDPCLRIHVSTSLNLRILCKIHVSGSTSLDSCLSILLSGASARSMSPDPCVRFMP